MPRILIVDDNTEVREALAIILEDAGYEVLQETNANDIEAVVLNAAPDAILLDAMMPGVNGFEALRRIRRNSKTAGLPVIMVTARAQTSDLTQAKSAGADDYIVKPFNPKEVELRVARLLVGEAA